MTYKKALVKKETEIKIIYQEIIKVDQKMKIKMTIIYQKNEELGKELKYVELELKEVNQLRLKLCQAQV